MLDSVWKSTPDYLPILPNKEINNPYKQYNQQIAAKQQLFSKHVHKNRLYVAWKANSQYKKTINVVKYAHTHLRLNNHYLRHQDYELTDIGAVKVHSKVGYNVLQLSYRPALWFTFLMNITKISWAAFVGYLVGMGIKYRRHSHKK